MSTASGFPQWAQRLIVLVLASLSVMARDEAPWPQTDSIKGLQVQMVDDAIALGVRHAGVNLMLGPLMEAEGKPGSVKWKSASGREFSFNGGYLKRMDEQIRPLSDAGMVVYLILLAGPTKVPAKDAVLLHPEHRKDYRFTIGGFNSVTPEGRAWLEAVCEMLAARWSGESAKTHGRVWGWILGNEVNSHWLWSNMGKQPLDAAVKHYESAFRLMQRGIMSQIKNARCYISLDHHWAHSMHGISAEESTPGRDFMDAFAKLAREGGDYPWHVAHHPYPEDLRNPQVWNDKSITRDDSTGKVTFKNLEVLRQHMERPEMRHDGAVRSIILSEQGFHTLPAPEGQRLQAAGYAYAWEKCQRVPGIDAFIYHRHVDNSREGNLRLGLWTHVPKSIADPLEKKELYPLFLAAGTAKWESAAQPYLSVIGKPSWEEVFRVDAKPTP
jgi:hypothetical protein